MKTKRFLMALIVIIVALLTFMLVSCGDTDPNKNHIHREITIPKVMPTCENTGLTSGKKCADCGEFLVAQEEIPASHTCNNSYTCSVCKQEP